MAQIITISSRQDNYIWLLMKDGYAVVVDPGEARPVERVLKEQGLRLVAILLTHHHDDHVGGVAELLASHPDCRLYGPHEAQLNHFQALQPLQDGDMLPLPELETEFQVLALPGHTQSHIGFYGPLGLFCGDVLFGGGCGRLLGGTAEQMLASLQRLKALPAETWVYCAHEYTWDNLRFCLTVEPDNQPLLERVRRCAKLRRQGVPTVPFPLAEELTTNCFLRTDQPNVRAAAQMMAMSECNNEIEIFVLLRQKKNNF